MTISLCPCRGVLVLAAALWQYVLPPRSSASLYDPADDEWMSESEGKPAGVETSLKYFMRFGFLTYFSLYVTAVRRWPSELD